MRRTWPRHHYPFDWEMLSHVIREKAGWKCQRCKRPHKTWVDCLPDGRWRVSGTQDDDFSSSSPEDGVWRNGRGKVIKPPALGDLADIRHSYTVLSGCHLDHDPMSSKLASLCRRCHLDHDREFHRWRAWLTWRARYALGDLWLGRYAAAR